MVKEKEEIFSGLAEPVVGHEEISSFLERAVAGDRLAHAYLFLGPRQVGKMAMARRLAARVLGQGTPLSRHPDFLTVERGRDAKSGKLRADIVLEQVHSLRGWLARGALMGAAGSGSTGWKVAILDGAQLLNKEAANALLKNLEEPQPRTLIILLAETADGVFPTIRSRCQIVSFGRVRTERIAGFLIEQGAGAEQAVRLASLGEGCPGRSLGYYRHPELLEDMTARRELLLTLVESGISDRWAVLEKAVPAKLPFNEAVQQSGRLLDLLAELLRDALLIAYGRGEHLTHADVRDRLSAWSAELGAPGLAAVLQDLTDSRRLLDENVSPRAVLESLALSF